jgi:hypothetical protein
MGLFNDNKFAELIGFAAGLMRLRGIWVLEKARETAGGMGPRRYQQKAIKDLRAQQNLSTQYEVGSF